MVKLSFVITVCGNVTHAHISYVYFLRLFSMFIRYACAYFVRLFPTFIFYVYSLRMRIFRTFISYVYFLCLFCDVALPLLIFYVFVSYACIKERLLLVCVIR